MPGLLVPAHLGDLHPYEQVLVWLLAFGPFLVLFAVVYVVRRRDLAAEEQQDQQAGSDDVSPSDSPAS